MDEHLRDVFLGEIVTKGLYAKDAVCRLERYLSVPEAGTFLVFEALFSYLSFTSNVSLVLWPSPKGSKEVKELRIARGEALRRYLGVTDDNILSDNRFRNHIAHADERLDDWWSTSEQKNIARQIIGPRHVIRGLDARETFEHLIPGEGVFIFRGEEYDLRSSYGSLMAIVDKAKQKVGSHFRAY